MTSKLIDIEAIGPTYARKLEEAGLTNTDQLLDTAGSADGRKRLAASTGLSEKQILEWVNRADLMRIKGIGSQFSDLLEASGVDTVKELAVRDPAILQARLVEVNEAKRLTRRTPSLHEVLRWVAEARALQVMEGAGDFWRNPSIEELARRQGVKPITSLSEFGSPEFTKAEADEIAAEIRKIRRLG